MKDLRINNTNTTICFPDEEGDVQICVVTPETTHREYIKFVDLKKWVSYVECHLAVLEYNFKD